MLDSYRANPETLGSDTASLSSVSSVQFMVSVILTVYFLSESQITLITQISLIILAY